MIRRRVMEHVRAQNWSAVALDFVIVVLGVFVGLQVQQWADQRAVSERTTLLMRRLEADFGVDVFVARNLHDYHKEVARHARIALGDITGQESIADDQLLIAAHRASQFNRFNRTSGIYEELVATGGLELVSSSEIGAIAAAFYKTTIIDDYETDGKASEYRRLYRSLVPVDIQLAIDTQCGDRSLTIGEMFNDESIIGYPCTLDVPSERLAQAAQILRHETALAPALRHRIATLETQNRDFGIVVDAIQRYQADLETLEQSALNSVFGAGR